MQPARNNPGCPADGLTADQVAKNVATAKCLLRESKNLESLKAAMHQALGLGMSLHEIESYLDLLEMENAIQRKQALNRMAQFRLPEIPLTEE